MIAKGRHEGRVKVFRVEKSFGFINILNKVGYEPTPDLLNSDDAFIHRSDIDPDKEWTTSKRLRQGQTVEFDLFRTERGLEAKNLIITGEQYDEHGEINGNYKKVETVYGNGSDQGY